MRGPWTALLAFLLPVTENTLPHTVHFPAFSLKRVPQVGQTLDGVEGESVIIGKLFSY
jgi:hypothetical protein